MRRFLSFQLLFTLLFIIGFLPIRLSAQNSAHDYVFSAGTMTFTPITNGTPITAIQVDDGYVNNIPIGFPFTFAGITYNNVSVSSNGWLSLAQVSSSQFSNTLTNAQAIDPVFIIIGMI